MLTPEAERFAMSAREVDLSATKQVTPTLALEAEQLALRQTRMPAGSRQPLGWWRPCSSARLSCSLCPPLSQGRTRLQCKTPSPLRTRSWQTPQLGNGVH